MTARLVELMNVAYTTPSNELRTQTINEAQSVEQRLTEDDLINVLALTRDAVTMLPVRAYAGTVVSNAVKAGRLDPSKVPCDEILAYLADSSADCHNVVANALCGVVLACCRHLYPQNTPRLLDTICPTDLHMYPRFVQLLHDFCQLCADPPFNELSKQRISALRNGIKQDAAPIATRVMHSLFEFYKLGEQQAPQYQMHQCLETLEYVSALLPDDAKNAVLDTLGTLVQFGPCAREALSVSTAVVGNMGISTANATLMNFTLHIVRMTAAACSAKELLVVQDILGLVESFPDPVLQRLAPDVVAMLQHVVKLPSIFFAEKACQIFIRVLHVVPGVPEGLDFRALVSDLVYLAPKHRAHPSYDDAPASDMSREQSCTLEEFDLLYSDFRKSLGTLLEMLSARNCVAAAACCAEIVANLPVAPSATDRRYNNGYLSQHSLCFASWDAAHYCIDYLARGFKDSAASSNEAVAHIQQGFDTIYQIALNGSKRNSSDGSAVAMDPTLVPQLLHIVNAYYALANSDMWNRIVEILFAYITYEGPNGPTPPGQGPKYDLDVQSARKAACVRFVSACTAHSAALCPLVDSFMQQVQVLMMQNSISSYENTFIYEGLACLSNQMDAQTCTRFLNLVLGPSQDDLLQFGRAVNPQLLADTVCARGREQRDQRNRLRDSTMLIASVLNRCDVNETTTSLALNLMPALGNIVCAMHQLHAVLPRNMLEILEMDESEREQLCANSRNRRPPNRGNNDVHYARAALQAVRQSLYTGLGTLAKFLSVEQFVPGLLSLLEGAEAFPVHIMKLLCDRCLFPACIAYPPLSVQIFPTLGKYLTSRSSTQEQQQQQNVKQDIAESKLLSFLCRATIGTLRRCIIDANVHLNDASVMNSTLSLLRAMLHAGYDERSVCHVLLPIAEQLVDRSAASSDEQAIALDVFKEMAEQSVANQRLQPRERESIQWSLCDLYVRKFPKFAPAFARAGVSNDKIEVLNQTLSSAPRMDARRKKFREFLNSL